MSTTITNTPADDDDNNVPVDGSNNNVTNDNNTSDEKQQLSDHSAPLIIATNPNRAVSVLSQADTIESIVDKRSKTPDYTEPITLVDEKQVKEQEEREWAHMEPSEADLKKIRKKYNAHLFSSFQFRNGRDYWNCRYEERIAELYYDWHLTFTQLKESLLPHLKNYNMKIMIPGCGNSKLGKQLVLSGFKNIICTDYSEVIIKRMRKVHEKYGTCIKYHCMDACTMRAIDSESFDLIIDKALSDSMSCSMQDIRFSICDNVSRFYSQAARILKPGGKLLVYSARDRSDLIQQSDTSVWSSIDSQQILRFPNENIRKRLPPEIAESYINMFILTKKDDLFDENSENSLDAMRRNKSRRNSILPKLNEYEQSIEKAEKSVTINFV
ncbi:hypothetical protein NAEGRDRAFT_80448 [Naegleria gruberi]|uniref:Methyltransferase type 11 domain-containing protein n=1 Tax=Naegleria gruberi TaxID=5762 RepID=D2VLI4_NAEGR|nr:uncharacterized protein NAEGRDRAFT_80448 [Naegleria gruberi]EFC42392.1 hypothetical protein NAEGRDRAFT_80448 [Naegleria gruberi]|eukprot:XP_002675136.1 hypothetical protein NAEGRDRAFT_80448 [Naegleria gruberi strain NEG-M]